MITFDNRDCGGSTRLEGVPVPNVLRAIGRALLRRPVAAPYTLEDMAADTVGLLDALGLERVHVVGASMGGMIGQMVAARHPGRVLSLTSIMSNSGNPARKYAFGRWKALRAIVHPPPPPDDHPAVVEHLIRVFGVIGSPGFRDDLPLMRPLFERVARRGLYRNGTARQLLAILATGDRRADASEDHGAHAGAARRGRSAGAARGRPRHGREHPGCTARGHRRHGARLPAHADDEARAADRRALPERAAGFAGRRAIAASRRCRGGGISDRRVTSRDSCRRACLGCTHPGGRGHRADSAPRRARLIQPLLRSPAAIPLIVRWMPRCVRSSRSPAR